MNYPLISEYISSILFAEDNLATKTSLRPVLDFAGHPIMSSGNFAVVFKMIDIEDNKHYAMKCFLRDQAGREESYLRICEELEFVESCYLLKTSYLPGELFVDTNQSDETEFPILLMEWVEGRTLGAYIADYYTDSFLISQLAYSFSKMATWLLSQDFAHGDIKPDNIIVKGNGNLVLVDYDGMYVPSMKGNIARENGSPNFRHPERTYQVFDEHIDDFALAVLNLTLKVLSLNVGSISTILGNDYCLFSEKDYRDICNSVGLRYVERELWDLEVQKLWGIFLIALSDKKLSSVSFRLASLVVPSKDGNYSRLTMPTEDERARSKESGIVVDGSGKRLIAANLRSSILEIPEGVEMICQSALQCSKYRTIVLPDSIKALGGIAFANNIQLGHINIPRGVIFIEHNNPFGGCINLRDIKIDSSKFIIDDGCLYSIDHQILYSSLFTSDDDVVNVHLETTMISGNAFWLRKVKKIVLPDGLSVISGPGTFGRCHDLININIPNSVVEIGSSSFYECRSLESISIPDSVKILGQKVNTNRVRGMFEKCKKLSTISLPRHIDYLGELFFKDCTSLKHVTIPNSVQEIGARAFEGCESLEDISIPANVKIIRDRVFCSCKSLKSIYIPDTVNIFDEPDPESIASETTRVNPRLDAYLFGSGMFSKCSSLEKVRLPKGISLIKASCFDHCKSLSQVDIPDTVTEIEDESFSYCEMLSSFNLPKQLQIIHKQAFAFCTSLERIMIPNELTSLYECSFEGCSNLRFINLPSKLTHLNGNPFPGCSNLNLRVDSDAFIVSESALYSYDKTVIHSYFGSNIFDASVLDGVKIIDRYCFSRSSIESITVPDSISTIKEYSFSNCSDLRRAILNGVTEISRNLFDSCSVLSSVSIPPSVTIIRERAFYNCGFLKDIVIPDSVETIEDAAFSGCNSLTSIELPNSIRDFSHGSSPNGIFAFCSELSVVTLNSYIPSLQEIDFNHCKKLNSIFVPYGDKKKYQDKLGGYYSLIVECWVELPF